MISKSDYWFLKGIGDKGGDCYGDVVLWLRIGGVGVSKNYNF